MRGIIRKRKRIAIVRSISSVDRKETTAEGKQAANSQDGSPCLIRSGCSGSQRIAGSSGGVVGATGPAVDTQRRACNGPPRVHRLAVAQVCTGHPQNQYLEQRWTGNDGRHIGGALGGTARVARGGGSADAERVCVGGCERMG